MVRISQTYKITDIENFQSKLLSWANQFKHCCFLNGNSFENEKYSSYDFIFAADSISEIQATKGFESFELLKDFIASTKDWIFGSLSYELKNEIENLSSNNFDELGFPALHFFQPKYLFLKKGDSIGFQFDENCEESFDEIFNSIKNSTIPNQVSPLKIDISNRTPKEEYINSVKEIKAHIQYGDIYEMNYCQEFYAENVIVEPLELYNKLNKISPTPFSAYYRNDDKYLLCASPERFIKKVGNKLISQPIKGTIKRGKDESEDAELKLKLVADQKERSENVMIVDLVRNDLSITANKASVKVEELFGIYTFKQLHQMISTITSELKEDVHFVDAIKYAFPMGSMTGAPKIMAMELIEKFEKTKRGLYSGSVGYITPAGDFDFNVVIRSILYNSTLKYLSFIVGGAITSKSIPENEYDECLLKAKAIFEVLGGRSA
ncbi:MAG: anthranilate synthase component I family protein [Saprospiraceae bacterium]|nr:anthranilate synthase component I family protein [Saprospiraceae bacterium]